MKCPNCQHEIPEDSKFCKECGCELHKIIETHSEAYDKPKSYTPKHLADKILKSKSSIIGERKLVTILFADVANYTSMSEKLDPEEVHQIMDGCFKILMDEIHDHRGTINQFTGDGVMAIFGAPVAIEHHAQDACLAALAIQKSINGYSKVLQTKYDVNFQMRIGINTGSVVVGAIGDDLRMDYTAAGDTTNLAARMESLAKPGTVLISPNTFKKVRQQFEYKSLGEMEIKGKAEPLEVYELIKDKVYRPRLGKERKIYSEMVGRDIELNKLELQVNKAINGDGSVVNIIGEAGIGKSRLISELRKRVVIKRATLIEGRAISVGRNLSFHPIIDLLKHWARISDDDTDIVSFVKLETAIRSINQQDADEILPFVATLMGMKLTGRYAERIKGIEGEGLEKLILKNIRDLLIKSTEITPLVAVIEDLHWADTSSIELLESLFRLAETQRITFINVFRPDHKETGERIVESIKERLPEYYVEINLEPLTEQMSETLIDNMFNIKGLHHGIKNKIVQRAGGNPFFIEEVVRSFIDEGAVVLKNGNFEVTDKIGSMVVPHTINDVLMARIDRLEDETRDLVKVASVIGRNFFHKILSEVAKSVKDIDYRLSHLKELQLIRERKHMEELEYLFKHALAQEAAYESILQQERKELHIQVAKSIENVFRERIHDFYGMLALHYSKAEDYKKTENYLIKAGNEAIRSSASSEALNYYQEGLRLYIQHGKDAKNPEKLAMFEKNIAIALYNKCRWEEAVEHIDEVFKHWNIPITPNRVIVLIIFIRNIIWIMTNLYNLYGKSKPSPIQRDKDIFDLYYKKGTALYYFNMVQLFYSTLNYFNESYKINISKSSEAINLFIGASAVFANFGLFKLSRKLLAIGNEKMDKKSIQNLMPYTCMHTSINHFSGDWGKHETFVETIINDALKVGDLWNTSSYIWMFCLVKAEKGEFEETELKIDRLSEIANSFDYNLAAVYSCLLKTDLMLKRVQLSEVLTEAERGYDYSCKYSTEMHELHFLSFRAEASILLNKVDIAIDLIQQANGIADRHRIILPVFNGPYLVAKFFVDLQLLKNSFVFQNTNDLSGLKKKVYQDGKTALQKLKNYAPYRTKTFRLMGDYYWLIDKKNKAFKWWSKAVKKGEQLGARPDLSRTYFEIGKALLDKNCEYKEWNGMSAQDYLNNARAMFKEMDLKHDLDELDKIAASN